MHVVLDEHRRTLERSGQCGSRPRPEVPSEKLRPGAALKRAREVENIEIVRSTARKLGIDGEASKLLRQTIDGGRRGASHRLERDEPAAERDPAPRRRLPALRRQEAATRQSDPCCR